MLTRRRCRITYGVQARSSGGIRFSRPTGSAFDRHPGIAKRYPGPSALHSTHRAGALRRCVARKSLGPGFRRDDGNGWCERVGREQPRSGESRRGQCRTLVIRERRDSLRFSRPTSYELSRPAGYGLTSLAKPSLADHDSPHPSHPQIAANSERRQYPYALAPGWQ